MASRLIVLLICFLPFTKNVNAQPINYQCKDYYLNGPNICWKNYGWDFGDNLQGWGGGNGYDAAWWENAFTEVENYKGNSVRVWVHCKGELNPLFSSGTCTGLNNNFFNNMDDMLDRAKNHNLMVIICLWDFHITDVGRQDVMNDLTKTNAYINNALIPMVQRYANQCNLLAWEIFNEPEWIMTGAPGAGNYGGAPVSVFNMQRFVGLCAAAVHNNSPKMVTLGSASLKWNSDVAPASGNYWKNSALTSASGSANGYLDFYQIHYYDWMLNSGNDWAPYNRPLSYWGLDKPVLIGETGNTGHYNYQQQFDLGYSNGYAGTMVWAYASGGAAGWSEFNSQMQTFRNAHIPITDFSCGSGACCTNPNLGADVILCGGVSSATLNSNAGSTTNKTYKWYRDGSLIGGATSSTYGPTSTTGTYVVEVDSMSGLCVVKDTMIISNTIPAPNIGPASANLCSASSMNLDAGSYASTPVTYAWQKNSIPIEGETTRYLNNIRIAGTYRVEVSSSGCATVSDEIVITSSLPTPIDACRTGTGTVSLSITNPGLNGTNYNWYDDLSAGSIIPGGTNALSVTTTSISETTTYYVQDMSAVSSSVGEVGQLGGGFGRNPVTDDYRFRLRFNTGAQAVTINFVTVWAWFNAVSTNYYVNLRILDGSDAVMNSAATPVSNGATGWAMKTIPAGFTIPANVTGWKMDARGTDGSPLCDLYYAPSGASYPYNSSPSGLLTITGHDATWDPSGYSYFYNWQISTGTSCARLPVIATVGSCSPLPVTLLDFKAVVENEKVLLTWSTSSESNNSHFVIERASDGINFESLGTVPGIGNSSSITNYSFWDDAPLEGVAYYRLRQVDIDNNFFLSEVITAEVISGVFTRIYPLPLKGHESLNIGFTLAKNATVRIILKDVLGKEMYTALENFSAGINEIEITSLFLNKGIYFLEIISDNQSAVKKVLVE